jgi:hypothetical protein
MTNDLFMRVRESESVKDNSDRFSSRLRAGREGDRVQPSVPNAGIGLDTSLAHAKTEFPGCSFFLMNGADDVDVSERTRKQEPRIYMNGIYQFLQISVPATSYQSYIATPQSAVHPVRVLVFVITMKQAMLRRLSAMRCHSVSRHVLSSAPALPANLPAVATHELCRFFDTRRLASTGGGPRSRNSASPPSLRSAPQYTVFGENCLLSVKLLLPTLKVIKNDFLAIDGNRKGRFLFEWIPRLGDGRCR